MEYKVFELKNKNGMKVKVTDLGANVMEIWAPDRDGNLQDVVMGFDTPEEYKVNSCFFGACIGRMANRINDAKFTLDGKYVVRIGGASNVDYKFGMVISVLSQLLPGDVGIINVSDGNTAHFSPT